MVSHKNTIREIPEGQMTGPNGAGLRVCRTHSTHGFVTTKVNLPSSVRVGAMLLAKMEASDCLQREAQIMAWQGRERGPTKNSDDHQGDTASSLLAPYIAKGSCARTSH